MMAGVCDECGVQAPLKRFGNFETVWICEDCAMGFPDEEETPVAYEGHNGLAALFILVAVALAVLSTCHS